MQWWILSLVNTWERCLFSQWHRWPASKLSGALWRLGWKRKESLQLRPWNLNSTSNSPVVPRRLSRQISANQSARSRNQRECKQTLKNTWKHATWVMTSLLMSSPPISNLHRLFRCRYSNYRDVASSPSFSAPPPECPGELARRLWHRRMERKNPSTPNSRTHNLLFSSPDALPSSYRRLRGGPRGGGGREGLGPPLFLDQTEKNFLARPPPPLSKGLDDRAPPLSQGLVIRHWDSLELRKLELGLCDKQSCKETFYILLGLECTVPSVFRAACVTCWVSIFHWTKKNGFAHICCSLQICRRFVNTEE